MWQPAITETRVEKLTSHYSAMPVGFEVTLDTLIPHVYTSRAMMYAGVFSTGCDG